MKLKTLRNILVGGQHFDEGCTFETDTDTAAALLTTRKVEVSDEEIKQPVKTFGKKAKATDAIQPL